MLEYGKNNAKRIISKSFDIIPKFIDIILNYDYNSIVKIRKEVLSDV